MAGPLGKRTSIPTKYSPEVLYPIERAQQRKDRNMSYFLGYDIWNIYELLWLTTDEKIHKNEISITIDANSKFTPESKSMKLYINSLVHLKFEDFSEVKKLIKKDLEDLTRSDIEIGDVAHLSQESEEVAVTNSKNKLSQTQNDEKIERVVSFSAFRSLCPVTNQPDIASVEINGVFSSQDLDHISKYLGSFFNKPQFHEACVEEILESLQLNRYQIYSVTGFFERRGGIAIIPRRLV